VLVWVKPIDAFTMQPLAGTEGAQTLFWSDDSQSIAFVADRRLKRIAAAGGDPQIRRCDCASLSRRYARSLAR
jgi:hypothetical protein